MAETHELVQGDSFAYDWSSESLPTLDANWTGSWAIVDKLGTGRTTLASGAMVRSGDTTKMEMRILPADTEGIDPGWYYIVAQLTNTAIGFNREVMQDQVEILPQGV